VLTQSEIIDEPQTAPPGMSTAPGRPAAILLFGLLMGAAALGFLVWLVLAINN
jgi:hypothetical protein